MGVVMLKTGGSGILSIDPFNYLDCMAALNDEILNHPLLDKINL